MTQTNQVWDIKAQVLSIDEICHGVFRAVFSAPEIAGSAIPFQFVNVKVQEGTDPLLRRPFSLSNIEPDKGTIELSWARVGKGTEIMSRLKPRNAVSMLGPLGRGFLPGPNNLLLVAGGTGLAPMYPLARSQKAMGFRVVLLYGARNKESLWNTQPFSAIGCEVHLATEDGSVGVKGSVVDLWTRFWDQKENIRLQSFITLACGPKPMLSRMKSIFSEPAENVGSHGLSREPHEQNLYLALEEHMACGMGFCRGCAVKSSHKDGGYLHVCLDGPVFPAFQIEV